jgi:NitT/TauT family transport system substrate-binding protein
MLMNRRNWIAGVSATLATSARAQTKLQRARIGVLQTTGAGPMYIALAKGYFAREGIEAEIIPFDSAQPLAVSIASGDLDFGATSLSAGFYNLAAQDVIRIIGAQGRDNPGFPNNGLVVTNEAWEKGLRDFGDIKGHSIGVATQGSGPHYCVGLLADKYGFKLTDMNVEFLKSNPNMVAAMATSRVDAAVMPSTFALSLVRNGQAKLIGWIGDVTPWQLGAAYTSTKHADAKPDYVNAFLRAYRAGMRDYAEAFISADGKRINGPMANELLAIMSKSLDQPAELISQGITYVDREARLDGKDIRRQIAWHRSQGLIEREVNIDAVLDKRYVMLLPE